MKIISWNVNGIRSCGQKGLFDFWERQNPDLLCLQETKAHPDLLEDTLVSPLGWQSYWSSAQRKGYSGTVIYTKRTPDEVRYGIGVQKYDAEGRFVIVRFGDLWIYNVYFPNGSSGEDRHLFKQEFLEKFSFHLRKQISEKQKVIVLGDYNVAYLQHDVFDPVRLSSVSGFLPEERKWFGQFLHDGFVDSFRHFHAEEKNRYSWWSYQENARMVNKGWRIDHICVTENLKASLRSANILEDQMGSDHCPVVLEMDLKA
jgi:exodeoxyribonuclease III